MAEMQSASIAGSPWLRRLSWLTTSLCLLVLGFLGLLAGFLAVSADRAGTDISHLPLRVWRALATGILFEALLPAWALAAATWLVVLWRAPHYDARWSTVFAGTALAALVWFPLVGGVSFEMWEPMNVGDYFATWALVSGGATAALLIPRLAPWWRPGRLAPGAAPRPPAGPQPPP